jgi:hypothetical protein
LNRNDAKLSILSQNEPVRSKMVQYAPKGEQKESICVTTSHEKVRALEQLFGRQTDHLDVDEVQHSMKRPLPSSKPRAFGGDEVGLLNEDLARLGELSRYPGVPLATLRPDSMGLFQISGSSGGGSP